MTTHHVKKLYFKQLKQHETTKRSIFEKKGQINNKRAIKKPKALEISLFFINFAHHFDCHHEQDRETDSPGCRALCRALGGQGLRERRKPVVLDRTADHRENDREVMVAYSFPTTMTESEFIARMLERYSTLIKQK